MKLLPISKSLFVELLYVALNTVFFADAKFPVSPLPVSWTTIGVVAAVFIFVEPKKEISLDSSVLLKSISILSVYVVVTAVGVNLFAVWG